MTQHEMIADALRRGLHHPGQVAYAWDDPRPPKDKYGAQLPTREESHACWLGEADRFVRELAKYGLRITVA